MGTRMFDTEATLCPAWARGTLIFAGTAIPLDLHTGCALSVVAGEES